jgi:methyl-accepting chemotaxis protein
MFKKLKVTNKIVLMICAVALPLLAATLFATVKGFNKDINFARLELKGNEFQRPLEALLDAIPRHQWLAETAAGGDAESKTKLAALEVEIDKAFADLDVVNDKYGVELLFTDAEMAKRKHQNMDPRSLRTAWNKLKKDLPQLNAQEIADQHSALVATVLTIIADAGNNSNLILDPDLDSYWLMDATVAALPQTQNRLGVVASYGKKVLTGAALGAKDTARFASYGALLQEADMDHIDSDLDTSLSADANFYGISPTYQNNIPQPLKAYNTASAEFISLVNLAATEPAKVSPREFFESSQKVRAAAYAFWKISASELDTLLQTRINSITKQRTLTLVGVVVGLAVSLAFAFFLSRSITRPLAGLTDATEKISKGNNSVRAPIFSEDEIGTLAVSFNSMVDARIHAQQAVETENKQLQANIQDLLVVVSDASDGKLGVRARVSAGALGNVCDALNLMFENVGELIVNAKTASDQVASAALNITSVAQQLEKGEQRQTREITVTSDGVHDLNGQAQMVLKNCQSANQAAEKARHAAEQGAKAVREVILGMEKIRENTQANAKKIKRLGDRSMEIGGIVKIIGDISAKTDMLALNASIEAARAGEQGRGFTVVAEQVRGLADRTKTLTSQIEKLVNDIQTETAEAVAQMETQTQEVEVGAKAAQSAGNTLENIVTVSAESSALVSQINQAASSQASRAQEMIQNVQTINVTVNEAAVKVRETRTTSEQLLTLSSELNKQLSQFDTRSVIA